MEVTSDFQLHLPQLIFILLLIMFHARLTTENLRVKLNGKGP